MFDKEKTVLIKYPVANSMKEYTIPNSVKNINGYTFYGCSALESVTIPDSVKQIKYYAFSNCSNLSNVTISEGVEEIGWRAFETTALTGIIIPASVKIMSHYVFLNCDSLTEVTFKSSDPRKYSNSIFEFCNNDIIIIVPYDKKSVYSDIFKEYDYIHVKSN